MCGGFDTKVNGKFENEKKGKQNDSDNCKGSVQRLRTLRRGK